MGDDAPRFDIGRLIATAGDVRACMRQDSPAYCDAREEELAELERFFRWALIECQRQFLQ